MTEKTIKILDATKKVEEILEIIRPNNGWEIVYGVPKNVNISYWDMKHLGLIDGEDYFFVFVNNKLLYAVNVTADSTLTAIYELVELLARKF